MPLINTFGATAARSYGFGNARGKEFYATSNDSTSSAGLYVGIVSPSGTIFTHGGGFADYQTVDVNATPIARYYPSPSIYFTTWIYGTDGSLYAINPTATSITIQKYDSTFNPVGTETVTITTVGNTIQFLDVAIDSSAIYLLSQVSVAALGGVQRVVVVKFNLASWGTASTLAWANTISPATAANSLYASYNIKLDSSGNPIFAIYEYIASSGLYNTSAIKLTTAGAITWQKYIITNSFAGVKLTIDTSNNVYVDVLSYATFLHQIIKIDTTGAFVAAAYLNFNNGYGEPAVYDIKVLDGNIYAIYGYGSNYDPPYIVNLSLSLSLQWCNRVSYAGVNKVIPNNTFLVASVPKDYFFIGRVYNTQNNVLLRLPKTGQILDSVSPWSYYADSSVTSTSTSYIFSNSAYTTAALVQTITFSATGTSLFLEANDTYTIQNTGVYP
jgi:hypothetical protein